MPVSYLVTICFPLALTKTHWIILRQASLVFLPERREAYMPVISSAYERRMLAAPYDEIKTWDRKVNDDLKDTLLVWTSKRFQGRVPHWPSRGYGTVLTHIRSK